ARTQGEALAEQQRQREQQMAELLQAERRQMAAQAALRRALARAGDTTVSAPRDGLIAEVLVRSGDRVPGGSPLVKIATVGQTSDIDEPSPIADAFARGDVPVAFFLHH